MISIVHRTQLAELVEAVGGRDLADGPGQAADDKGFRAGAVAKVMNAAQKLTVRDACGGKEDVLGRDQVVHGEDLFEVITGFAAAAQLVIVASVQLALDFA